eukprot:Blabericola_migrator_1__9305@NODE_4_length_29828_cov_96_571587_g3_i0_p9_GENE_NODE_4_length_29828_cov_96_571587_g3_i0NODE_4_length_29828_cov_96_571587_g3_i0_p9_ORF_typecomplete_len313_score38_93_NODE_4_length_29828_cov_96_571587_g3_i02193622874
MKPSPLVAPSPINRFTPYTQKKSSQGSNENSVVTLVIEAPSPSQLRPRIASPKIRPRASVALSHTSRLRPPPRPPKPDQLEEATRQTVSPPQTARSYATTARFGTEPDELRSEAPTLGPSRPSVAVSDLPPKPRPNRRVRVRKKSDAMMTELLETWKVTVCRWTALTYRKLTQTTSTFERILQQHWTRVGGSFRTHCTRVKDSCSGPPRRRRAGEEETPSDCLQLLMPSSFGSAPSTKPGRKTPISRIPEMMRAIEEENTMLESRKSSSVESVTRAKAPPPSALFYEQYRMATARNEALPKPPHLARKKKRQ